jgi:hypothetical protein
MARTIGHYCTLSCSQTSHASDVLTQIALTLHVPQLQQHLSVGHSWGDCSAPLHAHSFLPPNLLVARGFGKSDPRTFHFLQLPPFSPLYFCIFISSVFPLPFLSIDLAPSQWLGRCLQRYYVKFDDDIVYIADGAIDALLEEKLLWDRCCAS